MTYELQTDRLKAEVGSASIQSVVHLHDRETRQRFVTLQSVDDDGETKPQSVAYTWLNTADWNDDVLEVDKLIEDSLLMGETFRRQGFTVRQNRLLRCRLPLLHRQLAALYNCSLWQSAEVECYEFWANDILYGIVLEIKHPSRRQAPKRSWHGLYSTLKTHGVPVANMSNMSKLPSNILLIARLHGLLKGCSLYVHTRRLVHT